MRTKGVWGNPRNAGKKSEKMKKRNGRPSEPPGEVWRYSRECAGGQKTNEGAGAAKKEWYRRSARKGRGGEGKYVARQKWKRRKRKCKGTGRVERSLREGR